jgi:hypothetical protein
LINFWRHNARAVGVALLTAISLAAWYVSYRRGFSLAYNDTMSHLNVARLVVDNLQPGLSQLGCVWLPLAHVLMLPLIWNDYLWHSGLAGSIVSMVAYIISGIGIFKIVNELTHHKLAATVATVAFSLNLNELYLQSTSLTEPVYVGLFIFSILYLLRYLKTGDNKYLLPLGFLTALQILDRYDGWFVAFIEGLVLIFYELKQRKTSFSKAFGHLLFFAFPVIAAVLLWLGWSLIIFHDALYSFTGPYSAHAQQAAIAHKGGLITAGNLWMSLKAFGYDVVDTIGLMVLGVSILGWSLYLVSGRILRRDIKLLIVAALASVVIFNILALYLGFSILNVPEMHWNPFGRASGVIFNARYGVLALPLVAVGVGLLVARKRKLVSIVLSCVVVVVISAQGFLMLHKGIITIDDGLRGSSASVDQDVSAVLRTRVQPQQAVLLWTAAFNSVAFQSGLPLRQIIHEGAGAEWNEALATPETHAHWVVMANSDNGDPIYTSLVIDQRSSFLRYYHLVYRGAHANIYERKTTQQVAVEVDDGKLTLDHQNFVAQGVNSYDLAYHSPAEIAEIFRRLSTSGINTVRFWAFGDGLPDGFQPTSGAINESRLKTMDYILSEARRHNMRVIPVLANNWKDYGGIDQYVAWSGQGGGHDSFYSGTVGIALYKNYLNHIITRTNTITAERYADDSTILAWDLMNEPRSEAGDSAQIATWTQEMGRYVKTLDSEHLLTIGLDKSTLDGDNGKICSVSMISFCSVHIYVQDDKQAYYTSQDQLSRQLAVYRDQAIKIGKPIMIGEVGVSKKTVPFGIQPDNELATIIATARNQSYSGWLIWNWALLSDDSFGFSPNGTDGVYSQDKLQVILKASQK